MSVPGSSVIFVTKARKPENFKLLVQPFLPEVRINVIS